MLAQVFYIALGYQQDDQQQFAEGYTYSAKTTVPNRHKPFVWIFQIAKRAEIAHAPLTNYHCRVEATSSPFFF